MGMFTQRAQLTQQDARQINSTQLHDLGTVAETADGRVYRYASAGAVNLAAGLVNVTPAAVANHTNIAVAVAVTGNTGVRQVSVTVGATAVTTGQYDNGYLAVIDVAGQGCLYRVSGTPAIASSGTGVIQLEEQVMISLTTASKVSLVPSPWGNSIVHPGSSVSFICNGTNNTAVTAANYYWSQTSGMASMLSDGVIAKGAGSILSDAVAGAVETEVAATVTERVSIAPEATVTAKYYPQFLTLE